MPTSVVKPATNPALQNPPTTTPTANCAVPTAAATAEPVLRPAHPYLPQHVRDLAKSGISVDTAWREGIRSAPGEWVKQLLNWPAGSGIVFMFGGGFFRVKLDQTMKDGKQYRQPKGTMNRLYIPKTLDRAILTDPARHLYFTEGEKKAIKMCQEGLPAIASTGVYAWLHDGQPIPDLDRIAWEGRQVTIVFDSDPSERSKGQVRDAEQRLAAELTNRGAVVQAIHLPDDGQTKVGIDDFLVANSTAALRQLPVEPVNEPLPSLLNKWAGESKVHVSYGVEKLICRLLGLDIQFEYGVPVRTILNRGQPPNHLTTRVKFHGEPRIRVGKSKRAWPYAVVYYNLLRLSMQPKGRYAMAQVPRQWLPVWQGLMEIAAGTLVVPDEYYAELPSCAPQEARDVVDAWLQTLFVRQRAYPECPGSFNPGTVATMLGRPLGYVRDGWTWLMFYGYVDLVAIGSNGEEYYLPGRCPVADPVAYEREFFASLEGEVSHAA